MGAFNQWTAGSFLEEPSQRRVSLVALNLLLGAFALNRLQILRAQGFKADRWEALADAPLTREQISQILQEG